MQRKSSGFWPDSRSRKRMAGKSRDIKSALGVSMRAEEARVTDRKLDRFARAEAVLRDDEAAKDRAASPTARHQRVIRDSFTLPATDYELLRVLRDRGLRSGVHATKSELVRAGLAALSAMSEKDFLSALGRIERVKTGRPAERKASTVSTV